MRKIDQEYIDCIAIPDIGNGITEKNKIFFDFPDSAYQLLGKRGMRLVCAEVVLFMVWLKLRNDGQLPALLALTVLLGLVVILYEREYRYVRIYKKARKGAKTPAAEYTMKMVEKLVASKRIYFRDMPAVYSVLKAKALLNSEEPVAAELLMDRLLEEMPDCALARYIKEICAYMLAEDDSAADQALERARRKRRQWAG